MQRDNRRFDPLSFSSCLFAFYSPTIDSRVQHSLIHRKSVLWPSAAIATTRRVSVSVRVFQAAQAILRRGFTSLLSRLRLDSLPYWPTAPPIRVRIGRGVRRDSSTAQGWGIR